MPRSRRFSVAVVIAGITVAAMASACSGDDNDDNASTPESSGGIATLTAVTETPAPGSSSTQTPTGALSPATETPAAGSGTTSGAAATVSLADMVPCTDQDYFEVQMLPNGVGVLTYEGVPEGTPIVFPFEDGRLRLVDARAGAILLTYDVEGVGVFSVQAAGSSTLDRSIEHVTRGTVIGHFGGVFGEEETDVFEGHQLFAVAGSEELVKVGDTLFAGSSLTPVVDDCLVLP